MFDTAAIYSIFKSVLVDKAKEEYKPRLANKASMQAYAKAVGEYDRTVLGRASFGLPQIEAIDYV